MFPCCPTGRGCNASGGAGPCALELFREAGAENRDAAMALKRWSTFEQALERGRGERECRFRRRAFERARDRALIALALAPSEDRSQRSSWLARRRRVRERSGVLPR